MQIRYEDFNLQEGMPQREYRIDGDTIYCDRRNCLGSAGLRCYRTNIPICSHCSVKTDVGYLSQDAARVQQNKFFDAGTLDYLIAGGTAFFTSLAAGFFITVLLGWLFIIVPLILSVPAGGLVSEVTFRALRKKRGRYTAQAVSAGMALSIIMLLPFANLISLLIYAFLATGSATARFQLGLRV